MLKPPPLSEAAFGDAVRAALRDLHRPDRLGASPLVGSALGPDVRRQTRAPPHRGCYDRNPVNRSWSRRCDQPGLIGEHGQLGPVAGAAITAGQRPRPGFWHPTRRGPVVLHAAGNDADGLLGSLRDLTTLTALRGMLLFPHCQAESEHAHLGERRWDKSGDTGRVDDLAADTAYAVCRPCRRVDARRIAADQPGRTSVSFSARVEPVRPGWRSRPRAEHGLPFPMASFSFRCSRYRRRPGLAERLRDVLTLPGEIPDHAWRTAGPPRLGQFRTPHCALRMDCRKALSSWLGVVISATFLAKL